MAVLLYYQTVNTGGEIVKRLNQNVVNKNINVLKALRGWTDEEIAFKIGLSSSGYAKRKKNGNWSLNEAQCLSGLAGDY